MRILFIFHRVVKNHALLKYKGNFLHQHLLGYLLNIHAANPDTAFFQWIEPKQQF